MGGLWQGGGCHVSSCLPACPAQPMGRWVQWWHGYKSLKHRLGPPEQLEQSQPRLAWRDCEEEGKQNYTASLCSFVSFFCWGGIFWGSTVLILDFSGETLLDKETCEILWGSVPSEPGTLVGTSKFVMSRVSVLVPITGWSLFISVWCCWMRPRVPGWSGIRHGPRIAAESMRVACQLGPWLFKGISSRAISSPPAMCHMVPVSQPGQVRAGATGAISGCCHMCRSYSDLEISAEWIWFDLAGSVLGWSRVVWMVIEGQCWLGNLRNSTPSQISWWGGNTAAVLMSLMLDTRRNLIKDFGK